MTLEISSLCKTSSKGGKLVIPVNMRKMMSIAHSSHIGVEGCIRRVRDTLYWPQI